MCIIEFCAMPKVFQSATPMKPGEAHHGFVGSVPQRAAHEFRFHVPWPKNACWSTGNVSRVFTGFLQANFRHQVFPLGVSPQNILLLLVYSSRRMNKIYGAKLTGGFAKRYIYICPFRFRLKKVRLRSANGGTLSRYERKTNRVGQVTSQNP